MAAHNVCSWNKFGYYKHREYCRIRHVKELCENYACDISNCTLRHPKSCKFYRDYGKCKFNPCMFLHVENEKEVQIDTLKKENESFKNQLTNIEKSIAELDAKIVKSEEIISKLIVVEKKFDKCIAIEKQQFEHENKIEILNNKVIAMESKLCEKEVIINNLVSKAETSMPAESNLSENDVKHLLKKKNKLGQSCAKLISS